MMKLSDVKKPRVLVVVSDGNADIPDAVMSQLFADQLGADAQFADAAAECKLWQGSVRNRLEHPNRFSRQRAT